MGIFLQVYPAHQPSAVEELSDEMRLKRSDWKCNLHKSKMNSRISIEFIRALRRAAVKLFGPGRAVGSPRQGAEASG